MTSQLGFKNIGKVVTCVNGRKVVPVNGIPQVEAQGRKQRAHTSQYKASQTENG